MSTSNFSNWLKCLLLAICLSAKISSVLASPKMVVYWGQNSIAAWTNDPAKQEPDLRTYCTDSTYDIIVVGFVYLFPKASGSIYPGMNFANHCEQPFDDANPYVLDCTKNIAPDIQYCQQQGKKIFLSFGGGVGVYGFSSDAEAKTFGTLVWNMFLGGSASGVPRPFGNAIFDGIDLDIEGGTYVGYTAFINTLRTYFASSSRTYEISAAPQCFYPDRIGPDTNGVVGTTLSTAWFDYVWIQFYNNHCGVDEYGTNFNFNLWANWALTNSVNKNVKLFIGAPASPKAAASGYVPLATLQKIATDVSTAYPSVYGGLMLWDACTSDDNDHFGTKVGAFVHSQSTGGAGSSSGNTKITTGATPKPATTGSTPKPATTSSTPKPVTTGARKPVTTSALPATTGTPLPVTTGRVIGATTGKPSKITTGKQPKTTSTSTSTTGPRTTGVMTTGADASSSTSSGSTDGTNSGFRCNYGEMRCTSPNTYQSCGYAADGLHDWTASQACASGLVCTPSGIYIYCT